MAEVTGLVAQLKQLMQAGRWLEARKTWEAADKAVRREMIATIDGVRVVADWASYFGHLPLLRLLVERAVQMDAPALDQTMLRYWAHKVRGDDWFAIEQLEALPEPLRSHPIVHAATIISLAHINRFQSAWGMLEEYEERGEWQQAEQYPYAAQHPAYLRARLLWGESKREQARDAMLGLGEELLDGQPNAWVRLGLIHAELGEFEAERTALTRALAQHPESPFLYVQLGVNAKQLGEEQTSLDHFAKARELTEGLGAIQSSIERTREAVHRPVVSRLDVPVEVQNRDYCGPNALALVARYWGEQATQYEIGDEIWDQGVASGRMWQWAEANGYTVRVFRNSVESSRKLLELGVPVICERPYVWSGHYFILMGRASESRHRDDPREVRRRRRELAKAQANAEANGAATSEHDSATASATSTDGGDKDGDEVASRTLEGFLMRDPASTFDQFLPDEEFAEWFDCGDDWAMVMVPQASAHLLDGLDFADEEVHRAIDQLWLRQIEEAPSAIFAELEQIPAERLRLRHGQLGLHLALNQNERDRVKEFGEALLAAAPEDPVVVGRVGIQYGDMLRPEEALPVLQKARDLSGHEAVYRALAHVYDRAGLSAEAYQTARMVLRALPGEPETHSQMAYTLIGIGAHERALYHARLASEVSQLDPLALVRLGRMLADFDLLEEAHEANLKAHEVRPRWVVPRFGLAQVAEFRGDYDTAIEGYREIVAEYPWYAPVYVPLVRLLLDRGLGEEAQRLLHEGQERSPDLRLRLMIDEARLLEMHGMYDEAESVIEAVLAEEPEHIIARACRAELLLERPYVDEAEMREKTTQAIEIVRGILADEPMYDFAQGLLLDAIQRQVDPEQAANVLRERVEAEPENDGWDGAYLYNLQVLGREEEFLEWLSRHAEKSPNKPFTLSRKARALLRLGRDEDAEAPAREAITLDPEFAFGHGMLGEFLYAGRRWEEAEAAFTTALELRPILSFARERLIQLKLKREDPSALDDARILVRQDPRYLDVLLDVAVTLGRRRDALTFLEEEGHTLRKPAFVAVYKGNLYHDLGEFERAEACFAEALEHDPRHAWAMTRLGDMIAQRGDEELAEQKYRHALELSPDYLYPREQLISLLRARGGTEEALELAKAGFIRDPGNEDALAGVRTLYADLHRHHEGVLFLEQWLEHVADRYTLLCHIGILELGDDRPRDALNRFELAKQVNPRTSFAWRLSAKAREQLGDTVQAAADYREAIKLDPRDSTTLDMLIELERRSGEFERVAPLLERLAELMPGSPDMLATIYDAAIDCRAYDEGIALIKQRASDVREKHIVEQLIARLLVKAHRIDEARDAFEQAITRYPDKAPLRLHYGRFLDMLGERSLAREHLERALHEAPGWFPVVEAYVWLLQAQRDRETGIETLRRALRISPTSEDLAQLTIDYGVGAGMLDRVAAVFDDVAKLVPNAAYLWLWLGNAYRDLGEFDAALRWLDKACQTDPHDPRPVAVTGVVHSMRGELETARTWLRNALEIEPTYTYAANQLALLVSEPTEPRGHYRRIIESGADNEDAWSGLARLVDTQAELDEFAAFVETVAPRAAMERRIWAELAVVAEQLCDEATMGHAVTKLHEVAPQWWRTHLLDGWHARMRGEIPRAFECLRRAVEADRTSRSAWRRWVQLGFEHPESAPAPPLEMLAEWLNEQPNDNEPYYFAYNHLPTLTLRETLFGLAEEKRRETWHEYVGDTYRDAAEWEKALEYYRSSYELRPRAQGPLHGMASVGRGLGDAAMATRWLVHYMLFSPALETHEIEKHSWLADTTAPVAEDVLAAELAYWSGDRAKAEALGLTDTDDEDTFARGMMRRRWPTVELEEDIVADACLVCLGLLDEARGHWERARTWHRAAVKRAPRWRFAYYRLAASWMRAPDALADPQDALRHVYAAWSVPSPNDHCELGEWCVRCLLALERTEEALLVLQRLHELPQYTQPSRNASMAAARLLAGAAEPAAFKAALTRLGYRIARAAILMGRHVYADAPQTAGTMLEQWAALMRENDLPEVAEHLEARRRYVHPRSKAEA